MKRGVAEKRFFNNILKHSQSRCWNWCAYKNNKGYGKFVFEGETLAHRISYKLFIGEIPKGLFVCHHCDNPPCVNPAHLFLGTVKDNFVDMFKKGRYKKIKRVLGEANGKSKLTEKEVIKIKQLKEEYSQQQLAIKFNTHQTNIHYILSGKTWKHICV